ncbi:DUF294 nucleotidyltransferase-like domain-containing protein [Marinithermus hydrothermalis]|uniref:CBS domain and cyclic nucleotide-regulated nucleotidyltransferase n=1 Tax=Marinithermus hydrothermalis (strain DSM 14884 / JCM 11576 / T1) TaxID=869210 RepID=F2NPP4_MARHT|nr:DUF294 nucleotidyltransferase-like domain-containing protein [Marinithermus hydrothermalis]AEB12545.1 putative CBS domain and cyclic nucleotide-regulated nucleotidyltransferase [Marinithermus hydrothermalis DSM 14884]
MEPLEFLKRTPPFDALPPEVLDRVAEGLEVVYHPAGTRVLVRGGAPSRYLYVIRKGAVRLERAGRVALHLEEGEVFGYPSLLSGEPPAFDVVVEEDLLAYRVRREVFARLLEHPAFAAFFLKGLAERLKEVPVFPAPSSLGGLDFSQPVRRLVRGPPVFVPAEATVGEAARRMREHRISSVLVAGEALGILTDRDLRNRVLARGLGAATPVRAVMTAPAKTLPAGSSVFEALEFMLAEGVHHLPLVEGERVVGVVTDTDLLRHQAKNPLYLLRRLERTRDPEGLEGYALELAGVVEALLAGGLGVREIGRSVSALNDTLLRVLLRLAERRLGPPPVPYAWVVLGSEGRAEQLLLTDQDNALVYAEASPEAQAYFARLAEDVVQGLLRAGFPPCPGGYMATRWRYPLEAWRARFQRWVAAPDPQALLEAGIFFDFRAVHGGLSLEPLEAVLAEAADQRRFLAHLARAALAFRPPLTLFRRIREEEGGVDVKRGGIAPIVGLARVYALEARARARNTLERLEAARQAGVLSAAGAEVLAEAFGFLQKLRLRAQLVALGRGEAVGNRVRLEALSPLERRHLKEAFLAVREAQEAAALRYQTAWLG